MQQGAGREVNSLQRAPKTVMTVVVQRRSGGRREDHGRAFLLEPAAVLALEKAFAPEAAEGEERPGGRRSGTSACACRRRAAL